MDGEPAGAIGRGAAWICGGRPRIAGAWNGAESLPHHPEGLPEKEDEAGPVEDRKDLGEEGGNGAMGTPQSADSPPSSPF